MNRVLGAHPEVINVGSLKKLGVVLQRGTPCCCGAESLLKCPFWGAVNEELARKGKSLEQLDVGSSNSRRFAEDNLVLYRAIQAVGGAKVIIESSRRSSRLKRIRTLPGVDLIPLHLYKSPRCQASSWKRRERRLIQSILGYLARNWRIMTVCDRDLAALWVSYEDFCRNPEESLRIVFEAVGLEFSKTVLSDWGDVTLHSLGGNRMKLVKDSSIVLDESWRRRLTKLEIKMIDLFCGRLWRRMEMRRRG